MIEIEMNEMNEMNERKAHKPREKLDKWCRMDHDKYQEERVVQINDRRTIILSWFAVFHPLAKVRDS